MGGETKIEDPPPRWWEVRYKSALGYGTGRTMVKAHSEQEVREGWIGGELGLKIVKVEPHDV